MQHPDSGTRRWAQIWFAKYCLIYGLPLLFLIIAFHDAENWFLFLSLFWSVSVAYLAWRASNEMVSFAVRAAFGCVMVASWAYSFMAVYSSPGDTKICYDRIESITRWGPMINRGPGPYCDGIPLQDVKLD